MQKQYKSVPPRTHRDVVDRRYGSARTTQAQIPERVNHHSTRTTQASIPVPPDSEIEEDESYYKPAPIARTRRYVNTQGQETLEQGNNRWIVHYEDPPIRRRRPHWLLIAGSSALVVLLVIVGFNWLVNAWQGYQLNAQYGMPRTYQVDQVVGQGGDSSQHPSHFTFENLNGHVFIIELPAGSAQHAMIYAGPVIYGSNAASIPVTATFRDFNNDGKIDMLLQISNNQSILYLNNGSKFIAQQ